MQNGDIGNGLNEATIAGHDEEPLGGTGGSSGGGTIAGSGDPDGGTLEGLRRETQMERVSASPDDAEIAAEAGALGSADGALADAAAGARDPAAGTSIGESLGTVGRAEAGSGTPGDRGELGGGDAARDFGG
jgi:hypothetical protein